MKKRILSVGGGNMGRAIIGGLLARGYSADLVQVVDPDADARTMLQQELNIHTAARVTSVADIDVILLAVKPQIMQSVASDLATLLDGRLPLCVSIAAGITTTQLSDWLNPNVPIVRVMPNTPALVGAGAAALFATERVSNDDRATAESMLGAVGLVEWVSDESHLDAVTALSGSGPAYFFLFMEIMERVGMELGLDQSVARKLTIETAHGAALLARTSSAAPATLRAQVTSKGGTTESALEVLNDGRWEGLIRDALSAAHRRSQELAEPTGEKA